MKITNYKLQITNKFKIKIFKYSKLFVIWSLIIGTYLLFGAWNLVFAQNFSLSITPPLLEVMVKPGRGITQVYKLTNQGADAQIYASIAAFEPSDELGNINLNINPQSTPKDGQALTINHQYLSWFSFQNTDIKLPGGFLLKSSETQELVLKIRVPDEAEEKDYYSALLFQVKPDPNLIYFSGPQTSGIIATNILLTVSENGLPPKVGKISEIKTDSYLNLPFLNIPVFDSFDSILISLKISNTGRTIFKPIGSVKIINPLKKEIEFIEILPQNILAHSERKLFKAGTEENPVQEIIFKPTGFAIGKHKAKAGFFLSDSKVKLEAETSFLIFPWKICLGFLTVIILILIIRKFFKKAGI